MMRARWVALAAVSAMLLGGCGEDEPTDAPAFGDAAEPAPKAQRPEPKSKPKSKSQQCWDSGPANETVGEALERCDPTYEPIPEPTTAQAVALVATLAEIEPALASESESVVDDARNTCTTITDGGDRGALLDATVQRFSWDAGYPDYDMPESSARSIVAAITSEPWCR